MTRHRKIGLIAAGGAIGGVLAIAGFATRGPELPPASTYFQPANQAPLEDPVAAVSPFGWQPNPAAVESPMPENPPLAAPEAALEPAAPQPPRSYLPAHHRRARVVVRKRPLRRSLEIVAGSAAGGALIGGLAGGGKGAGIGALAGGAGGYIYDRLTHEKRVVVR